jgi:hypothetical protein
MVSTHGRALTFIIAGRLLPGTRFGSTHRGRGCDGSERSSQVTYKSTWHSARPIPSSLERTTGLG